MGRSFLWMRKVRDLTGGSWTLFSSGDMMKGTETQLFDDSLTPRPTDKTLSALPSGLFLKWNFIFPPWAGVGFSGDLRWQGEKQMIPTSQFICGIQASSSRLMLFLQRKGTYWCPRCLLPQRAFQHKTKKKILANRGQSTSHFKENGYK